MNLRISAAFLALTALIMACSQAPETPQVTQQNSLELNKQDLQPHTIYEWTGSQFKPDRGASNLCLNAGNNTVGSNPSITPCGPGNSMAWIFSYIVTVSRQTQSGVSYYSYYQIRNAASNLCLDANRGIVGSQSLPPSVVYLNNCDYTNDNQLWTEWKGIYHSPAYSYKVHDWTPKVNEGRCLDGVNTAQLIFSYCQSSAYTQRDYETKEWAIVGGIESAKTVYY